MPFCSNCGAKLEDGAKFCPNCGAKVAGGDVTPQTQTDSSKAQIKLDNNLADASGLTGWKIINADTGALIARTHGGEIITVDAPIVLGLDHLGYRKLRFEIKPGKKYEGKLATGVFGPRFIINEVDFFGTN